MALSPFQAGLTGTALPPLPSAGLNVRSASLVPAAIARSVAQVPAASPHTPVEPSSATALVEEARLLGGENLKELKAYVLTCPEKWVWDGVIPAGTFNIFGAESKAGKTTLMRNLTLAVAQGTPFLGRATTQGTVLYFMLEDRPYKHVQFFEAAGSLDLPVITVRAIPDEFRDEHGNMLMPYLSSCIKLWKPTLVVLDMFVNAFPGVEDFNNYVEVSRHMIGLIELIGSKHPDTAVIATHHMHKAKRGESGTNDPNRLLGSVAFNGRAHSQIMLDMKDHQSRRFIATIQRDGRNIPRTPLKLDDETLVLRVDGIGDEYETAEGATDPTPPLIRRVVGAVWRLAGGECDYGFTAQEVATSLGTHATHEIENLRAAVHAGWLLKAGKGVRGDPYKFSLNPSKLPLPEWRALGTADPVVTPLTSNETKETSK